MNRIKQWARLKVIALSIGVQWWMDWVLGILMWVVGDRQVVRMELPGLREIRRDEGELEVLARELAADKLAGQKFLWRKLLEGDYGGIAQKEIDRLVRETGKSYEEVTLGAMAELWEVATNEARQEVSSWWGLMLPEERAYWEGEARRVRELGEVGGNPVVDLDGLRTVDDLTPAARIQWEWEARGSDGNGNNQNNLHTTGSAEESGNTSNGAGIDIDNYPIY